MLDRCRIILKSFIYDGENTKQNIAAVVADARMHLDQLAHEPDRLKQQMSEMIDEGIQKGLDGR